jgi:transglutaminase-like putative cysteine protease
MLYVHKQLEVRYDRAVCNATRRLRVRPLDGHASWRGDKYLLQRVVDFQWRCEPLPSRWSEVLDDAGAPVLSIVNDAPHRNWNFHAHGGVQVLAMASQQLLAPDTVGRWLLPSRLCERTPRIIELARSVEGCGLNLALRLNAQAHASLCYEEGATDSDTTAGMALQRGAGVCQDFAHLLIALCRARGMPARYIAGWGHAAGRAHAWVEVLTEGDWHALDPTNHSPTHADAVAVAVGRDFRDCAPLHGTFETAGRARSSLRAFCTVARQGKAEVPPQVLACGVG